MNNFGAENKKIFFWESDFFMAAKRIYQIAKEFECDEKKIIEFLTGQGIKVANRLSAVSEDSYNLLKEKLFAPPPPPPEPKPEPVVEKPAQETAQPVETKTETANPQPAQGQAGKKKKKKKKSFQPAAQGEDDESQEEAPVNFELLNEASQAVTGSNIVAGNDFIRRFYPTKKQKKENGYHLSRSMEMWGLLQDIIIEDPDLSPISYWQAINKLTTKAYKLLQEYGLKNRELMAEIREAVKSLAAKYEPQEIFTDEENQKFEAQQKFMLDAFGHGMGKVNDNLYELKMYAEQQKRLCEHMSFVDYLKNPDAKLERQVPMPFHVIADTILYSIRSVPCHVVFYLENKPQIIRAVENFHAWIDGYKKLKEQGADAAKLEKYLDLQDRLFRLIEFMSYDNLVYLRKKKDIIPFDIVLGLLNEYRDNMDDPDAERNFKYKVRGVTNLIYKPKEYIFLYHFAGLEPNKEYRTPEMIAEAEAKKAAEAAAKAAEEAAEEAAKAAEEAAKNAAVAAETQENPAAENDEA